jgi:hypothetical protein
MNNEKNMSIKGINNKTKARILIKINLPSISKNFL